MRLTEGELKELHQRRTARSKRGTADCVTEDELIKAASKELGIVERQRLIKHLRMCSDCAREYRIAHSLKTWSEGLAIAAVPATAGSAASQSGQPVRPASRIEESAGRPWAQRFAVLFSSARVYYALATLLFVLSLALGAWVVSLRKEQRNLARALDQQATEATSAKELLEKARRELEENSRRETNEKSEADETKEMLARDEAEIARLRRSVADFSRPQLDIPIVDLDPAPDIRGRPEHDPTRIQVPASAKLFTLILNFTDETDHSLYEVEILNLQGQRIWSGQKTRRVQAQNLNITLARRVVPEGRYVIKLSGVRQGKRQPVATYSLQLRYQ